ncbi:MAG: Rab family GTPase [Candidatus Helarchaeota archaeon]
MTESNVTWRFKLVLFGNENVGKTSLVDRLVNNRFQENYISTLGYNVYEKQILYNNVLISLLIFDIGGQEKFRPLRQKYATGANTALLVFDITSRSSFENLPNWKNDLGEFAGTIPFIVVGNKVDLENLREVSTAEAQQLAIQLGALTYFETSAKTGFGVDNAFQKLAIKTYELHQKANHL